MDLPKTMSLKMKTAKDTNNAQSQITIKLHQLIRRVFVRYLYSGFDSLQTKKTLAADHAKQKTELAVLKYGAMKSQKLIT